MTFSPWMTLRRLFVSICNCHACSVTASMFLSLQLPLMLIVRRDTHAYLLCVVNAVSRQDRMPHTQSSVWTDTTERVGTQHTRCLCIIIPVKTILSLSAICYSILLSLSSSIPLPLFPPQPSALSLSSLSLFINTSPSLLALCLCE